MRTQVMTGSGSLAECLPPVDLCHDDPPSVLLQRVPVRDEFSPLFRDPVAYATLNGRQYFSNVTGLWVGRSQWQLVLCNILGLVAMMRVSGVLWKCAHIV
jgi:hypothetical protein